MATKAETTSRTIEIRVTRTREDRLADARLAYACPGPEQMEDGILRKLNLPTSWNIRFSDGRAPVDFAGRWLADGQYMATVLQPLSEGGWDPRAEITIYIGR